MYYSTDVIYVFLYPPATQNGPIKDYSSLESAFYYYKNKYFLKMKEC